VFLCTITLMAQRQERVLVLQTVATEGRKMWGFNPDDAVLQDLRKLQPRFEEERHAAAWCVCGRPIRNVHRLTRRRLSMSKYAEEGLVEVVRVAAGTAPPDAVAAVGEGRNPLVNAFLVRTPGTKRYSHAHPAWGWVSKLVPSEFAREVRHLLDPAGIVQSWGMAPNSDGVMREYA